MAYDNLNRLTSRTYPTTADNVSYTYDLLGRRLTAANANALDKVAYAWDNAGRMTSTTAGTRVIAYQYDAAGNRTRMTWPDTAFFVTTAYDALNRPTTIKEKDTAALASYAYDDLSRRTVITLGNGTTTSYGYNPQGDLSTLAHDLASTANDQAYTYTRNQAREIVTHSWSNDLYQWPVTGLVANGTKSYTANGRNQYTAAPTGTVTHDANGNMTGDGLWTYTYDENNRLKSANRASPATAITMGYDAEGRLRVVNPGAATSRLYDGHDLVGEYNSSSTLIARHVHGPGVDEPLVSYNGTGAATKNWLYADHLGSIVASASSTGAKIDINKYSPFGEPNNLDGGTRFKYTGQQTLGFTGLMYYKARFYDPRLGRFLQTDPIGTADDMNLYAYVGNNPVNLVDPTGMIGAQASQMVSQFSSTVADHFVNSFWAAKNDSSAIQRTLDGMGPGVSMAVGGALKLGRIAGRADDVAGAAKGLAGVPGRVGSRINLSNEGMKHVIARHLSGKANASQFSLSEAELRSVLSSRAAVNSPVVRSVASEDGIRYVREFDAGRVIGADKFNGNQATSMMTIMTDRFGNLVSTFPGLLK